MKVKVGKSFSLTARPSLLSGIEKKHVTATDLDLYAFHTIRMLCLCVFWKEAHLQYVINNDNKRGKSYIPALMMSECAKVH